jgi:hypothetical protein
MSQGWREAAGVYAEEGSFRSVADVVDEESLAKVRAFKQPRQAGRATVISAESEPEPGPQSPNCDIS